MNSFRMRLEHLLCRVDNTQGHGIVGAVAMDPHAQGSWAARNGAIHTTARREAHELPALLETIADFHATCPGHRRPFRRQGQGERLLRSHMGVPIGQQMVRAREVLGRSITPKIVHRGEPARRRRKSPLPRDLFQPDPETIPLRRRLVEWEHHHVFRLAGGELHLALACRGKPFQVG